VPAVEPADRGIPRSAGFFCARVFRFPLQYTAFRHSRPRTRTMLSRRAALGGLITLPSLLPRVMAAEPTTVADAFTKSAPPITAPEQALNVMDFESLARNN